MFLFKPNWYLRCLQGSNLDGCLIFLLSMKISGSKPAKNVLIQKQRVFAWLKNPLIYESLRLKNIGINMTVVILLMLIYPSSLWQPQIYRNKNLPSTADYNRDAGQFRFIAARNKKSSVVLFQLFPHFSGFGFKITPLDQCNSIFRNNND